VVVTTSAAVFLLLHSVAAGGGRWQLLCCSSFFSTKISAGSPVAAAVLLLLLLCEDISPYVFSFVFFSFSIRFCFFPLCHRSSHVFSLLKKTPFVSLFWFFFPLVNFYCFGPFPSLFFSFKNPCCFPPSVPFPLTKTVVSLFWSLPSLSKTVDLSLSVSLPFPPSSSFFLSGQYL